MAESGPATSTLTAAGRCSGQAGTNARMASGASDSMWFRYHGVSSYGASPVFIKSSDDFSHGLNERMPTANITPGITYYLSLLGALAK